MSYPKQRQLLRRYRRLIEREFGVSTDVLYKSARKYLDPVHDSLHHERHSSYNIGGKHVTNNIICIYYMRWMIENKELVILRLL